MTAPSHGKLDTFLLCIALGVGYALLGWLVHLGLAFCFAILPPSAWLSDFTGGLPFRVFYGSLNGAVWSIFAIPILRHRPLKPVGYVLALVLATIAVGGALLGAFKPTAVSDALAYLLRFGSTVVFIITCIVLWRVLPATPPLSVCTECGNDMSNKTPGVCSECGDTSLFRRYSRRVGLLALFGLSVSAGIAVLFVLTRNHSCGYYGYPTVVGFERGALLLHFDALRYEGWFWSDVSFVPMSGYVWWPVFTEKTVLIPLWIAFVLLLVPSLLVWRRSRRPPPGFCLKCGYDLAGNVSGVCSECGLKIESTESDEVST